ncbi:MAG: adaptor protein MecA [Lachnospiraceae bacterium]|nr:adaptor protein MecA [Lachnospiraceae bacterium]
MKIEKVNENQIRCTLNISDLRARKISLSELAYGSEKARQLFREMLEQAYREVGFQSEDAPLMIEAIPLSGENILMLITKVEDPEELDTRFARFAPGIEEGAMPSPETVHGPISAGTASDILDTLSQMFEQFQQPETGNPPTSQVNAEAPEVVSIYRFSGLDPLLDAAAVLQGVYVGRNSLFKSDTDGCYYLIVHKSGHTPEEFNKTCNILAEYGRRIPGNPASEAYFTEHFRMMIADRALQTLVK